MDKQVPRKRNRIAITLPSLKDPGGVAEFYNSILPSFQTYSELQIHPLEIGRFHGRGRLLHALWDQFRFFGMLLKTRPDLVHINPSLNFKSYFRDGLFVLWARRCNIPTLIFFHGWDTGFEHKLKRGFSPFFRLTYRNADAFVVLATPFKSALETMGVSGPVFCTTTVVNPDLLNGFSIEEKLKRLDQADHVKLLFLSRVEKEKGIFETVEAFARLIREYPGVTLSIAGDGKAFSELKNRIVSLGLSDSVQLLGDVRGDRKSDLFRSHDIYCLPTYHPEGMPLSIIEAMAFGMPVITRPVGGIKDFFRDGEMGYLCQSSDPGEIAANIRRLILDKQRILRISRYNHHYARNQFAAQKVADRLRKIYMNLLKNIPASDSEPHANTDD